MPALLPFLTGPAGRSLVVDSAGRIVTTGDSGNGTFVFGYGDTGRTLVVDASGRMVISPYSVNSQAWQNVSSVANGAQSLDGSNGNRFDIVLDNDTTLTISNPVDGARYTFLFTQASGNNTVAWESRIKWPSGSAPTITAPSGSQDVVSMIYNSRLDTFFATVDADFS